MTLSIDEMYAYIAANEEGEGITAQFTENGWLPLVGADRERMESLREVAQIMADDSGKRVVLARFSVREDVEIIEPRGSGNTPMEKF